MTIRRIKKVVKPGKKAAASKTPTRARKTAAPAKKTAAKKVAAKPGPKRELNKVTGFSVGSDQDVIATALLEGGASRAEITEKVAKLLPAKTRTGTPKPITNLVSSVYNNLARRGYRTEESFKVLPPTPASKARATREAKKVAAGK